MRNMKGILVKFRDFFLCKCYIISGITNQKIEYESFEIVSTFFVSTYIQIKANTDTKGIDAKIAPTNELLFESSDIPTIKIAEIKTFIM